MSRNRLRTVLPVLAVAFAAASAVPARADAGFAIGAAWLAGDVGISVEVRGAAPLPVPVGVLLPPPPPAGPIRCFPSYRRASRCVVVAAEPAVVVVREPRLVVRRPWHRYEHHPHRHHGHRHRRRHGH